MTFTIVDKIGAKLMNFNNKDHAQEKARYRWAQNTAYNDVVFINQHGQTTAYNDVVFINQHGQTTHWKPQCLVYNQVWWIVIRQGCFPMTHKILDEIRK